MQTYSSGTRKTTNLLLFVGDSSIRKFTVLLLLLLRSEPLLDKIFGDSDSGLLHNLRLLAGGLFNGSRLAFRAGHFLAERRGGGIIVPGLLGRRRAAGAGLVGLDESGESLLAKQLSVGYHVGNW